MFLLSYGVSSNTVETEVSNSYQEVCVSLWKCP